MMQPWAKMLNNNGGCKYQPQVVFYFSFNDMSLMKVLFLLCDDVLYKVGRELVTTYMVIQMSVGSPSQGVLVN